MLFFRNFFIILLFTSSFLFAQSETQPSKSFLEFKEDVFDFGLLKSDSMVAHVFKFQNTGQDTIEIYNVGSS